MNNAAHTQVAETPFKNRISVKLLRYIFVFYILVVFVITAFQMLAEYQQSRQRIIQAITSELQGFQQALTNAVWNLDVETVDYMIGGFLKFDEVVGASIHSEGKVVARAGLVARWEEQTPRLDLGLGITSKFDTEIGEALLWVAEDLYVESESGQKLIGTAYLYSSRDVVLATVWSTFINMIVAAVLKTAALWMIFLYFGRKFLHEPLYGVLRKIASLDLLTENSAAHRPDHEHPDEIAIISAALTATSERLKHAITELDQANRALLDDNYLLQRAVEFSPIGISIVDRGGHFAYYNPAFLQQLRLTASALSLTNLGALFGVCLVTEAGERLISALRKGDAWSGEFYYKRAKHEPRWLRATMAPIRNQEESNPRFILATVDISEGKELQRELAQEIDKQRALIAELNATQNQLVQSEKLATLGQLAAGVAHEINNPVSFVSSNTAALGEYVVGLLQLIDTYEQSLPTRESEVETLIDRIKEEIDYGYIRGDIPQLLDQTTDGLERIKNIVADLKNFGRNDSDQYKTVDVNEVVNRAINIAWNKIKYVARLEKQLESLPHIAAKQGQLTQVVINLLVNAAQAIDQDGVITVTTRRLAAEEVEIVVADTGHGISAEDMQKIFDPFFTTKRAGEGTGLGLSIAQNIAIDHGGSLYAESTPGRGTSFHLRLPINQQAIPAEPVVEQTSTA
jgi:PAS domain S-box-containing protein